MSAAPLRRESLGGFVVSAELSTLFGSLRALLARHASELTVSQDTTVQYMLEAPPGPAALRAWRGEVRKPQIPVAWVEVGAKAVNYHLMGLTAIPERELSDGLRARRQGKTCFRFTREDAALFAELAEVTTRGVAALRTGGFISGKSA